MKDELRINGKDAYTTWGISMDNNALSELMTPSSNKTFIENVLACRKIIPRK